MDESKAILNLLTDFPYKSEEYLRTKFRKCNYNMSATIRALNDECSPEPPSNLHGSFFQTILSSIRKLCCCTGTQEQGNADDIHLPGTSTSNEGFVEINIGEEFAKNLEEKFSDSSLILPSGFQPIIEIPVALGRQLYASYVESIFRQQEAYKQVVVELVKEDEEFARRLEAEDGFELGETSTAVEFNANKLPIRVKISPFTLEVNSGSFDEIDTVVQPFPQSAESYREQARQHLQRRKQLYNKARRCIRQGNRQLANKYFQQAREHTLLYEETNRFASAAFLAENRTRNPSKNTIDLHHLFVKEAIQALDIFLDNGIISLQNCPVDSKALMVITGRGKHSVDGIPKIKPAVLQRLSDRRLDMSATVGAVDNDRPSESENSSSSSFFQRIINSIGKLCCCSHVVQSEATHEIQQPTTTSINYERFPHEQPRRPAEPSRPSRQDEVNAKRLQNQRRFQIPSTSSITERNPYKSKELPSVHRVIDTSDDPFADALDETDLESEFPQSAESYREQAKEHLQRKKILNIKARQLLKHGNRQLADYFFQLAKEQTKLHERANNFAAAAFLVENQKRNPSRNTIDLHHLFVKEAIQALDIFLDDEINSLQNSDLKTKQLSVITGRGKHSVDGIPKIKPAVVERLNERRLQYSQLNPGLLEVYVSKYSLMSNNI